MSRKRRILAMALLASLLLAGVSAAQRGWRGGWRGSADYDWKYVNRGGVPEWDVPANFPGDVFTFVRIKYTSSGYGYGWQTDFPDSDLNFSLRLQQLTSLEVNPQPVILELTDPELFNYPFVYMIEPGGLHFHEEEVSALRRYLLNGGFLLVDDFWGEREWAVFYEQIKRVFPNRSVDDVPLSHEIFHCVYDLKEKPQIPSIHAWGGRGSNVTWERWDAQEPHYRAIWDDDGRMMVFICHNTDLGDGWEREAADPGYFEEFSVKKAYPMGINIVTYAMTH